VLHDLEGRIVYLNQAGLDFAGFEPSEAVGQTIATFISPKRLADLEARRGQRLDGDEASYRYETEFVNRTGQRMLAEVHSTPILRNGRVSEILLVARDITERKLAEEALRRSEERLRLIVEGTKALLVNVDERGRITYVNEAAATALGHRLEDLIGQLYLLCWAKKTSI
jgi:PAS domain S-box-containing protein